MPLSLDMQADVRRTFGEREESERQKGRVGAWGEQGERVRVCVCERERERERETGGLGQSQ